MVTNLQRGGNYAHFSSISTNDRILRIVGLVVTLITACITFYAYNTAICAFNRRNSSIRKEIIGILRQNLIVVRIFKESGLVSALKVACTRFGL
jgi:spore maturation protein SpmA